MPDSGAFGPGLAPQRGTLLHIYTGSHDTAFAWGGEKSDGHWARILNLQSLLSSQFNRKSNDR